MPKLSKRQEEVWKIVEEWRELPLQELLQLTDTTAETVRRLEDKGLLIISAQISERDPYGHEHILPTLPITLNPEQARALEKITTAMGLAIVPLSHPTRRADAPSQRVGKGPSERVAPEAQHDNAGMEKAKVGSAS